MNTTTKSNSKEFIEIPSNSTMAKDITSYKKNKFTAIVFGKRKGAIAGAFGMGLFDLLSEWAIWAPFTFVVRGVMGYIIGSIAWSGNKKGESIKTNIFAIIISGVWMIFGYYVTEMILYGNHAKAMLSIPGNITQIVIGLVIGVPIAKILRKYIKSNI